jgi:hypothetical protein
MPTAESRESARKARRLYDERLRQHLEATHRDEFVAVEPESGNYFLGKTSLEAGFAARRKYPDRLALVMRIGHDVAHHIGSGAR